MQEVDAERRTQILRGQRPSTPPPPPSPPSSSTRPEKRDPIDETGRYKKRRRLAGENDTDRDIRLAQEDAAQASARREKHAVSVSRGKNNDNVPLLDSGGHINLFPTEGARGRRVEKNAEAEKEAAEKKRSYEDQYTMRFSNAAGFKQSVGQKPWYSSASRGTTEDMPSKNVWGNEDPMRREREMARMDANDPLAAMKKGVRQLKSVESERKKWNEERNRELEALKDADRRESHRRRRRSVSGGSDEDSLDGFNLDSADGHRDERHRRSSGRRHHHRERSRDGHRRHSRSHSSRHHHDSHASRHDGRRSHKSRA